MRARTIALFTLACLGLLIGAVHAAPPLDDWDPIPADELALKSHPAIPGGHAIILYREEFTDDVESASTHYYRIKIFTQEGKKHGDIEIPFLKGWDKVYDIKARTVLPDGRSVEFKGEVYEKTIVKARGVKFLAKTFSMPEVQEGAILEYKYRRRWDNTKVVGATWYLQEELFTRRARFAIRPYSDPDFPYGLAWRSYGLPPGADLKKGKRGFHELELENLTAVEEEDFPPPDRVIKSRVQFFYADKVEDSDVFWGRQARAWHDAFENYIGKRKGIQQAVVQVVSPNDSPDDKLKKIYDRVTQIHNTTYERDKTEQEEKREKRKTNNNVEDVLKNGYGSRMQINLLFVAMARAAGLEAIPVRISERDTQFFNKDLQQADYLDGDLAMVRIGDQERFFDPGSPYCPFGLLAWQKTGVQGIRLERARMGFMTTPQPTSRDALVERRAELVLDDTGSLSGTLKVTFKGYPAQSRRRVAAENDDAGRRKDLEEDVQDWFPSGAKVTLQSVSSWEGTEPLDAEFKVEMPNFAVATGRRMLLPLGVFHANQKHPFQHAQRVHPVYFRYPWQELDEIIVKLPEGFRVETVPTPKQARAAFGLYQAIPTGQGNALKLQRRLIVEGVLFPVNYYPQLRNFFSQVRSGDEEQIVLQASTAGAQN